MNRRGDIIIRLIVLAVSVLVITYMGVQIYTAVHEPVRTVMAILATSEETAESVGIFVRNEVPIQKNGDIYELLVDEGDRVSRNQAIAEVYNDQSALSRAENIKSISEQIKQLEYAKNAPSDITSAGKQTDQIYDAVYDILNDTGAGDFTRLDRANLQLKSLVLKREYMYSNPEGLDALLESLKFQRSEAQAVAGSGIMSIYSESSGTFSAQVDGFESALAPQKLDTITINELRGLISDSSYKDTSGWLGKVMRDFDWYFATILPAASASKLRVGDSVKVRFSPGFEGEVNMRVTRIDTGEKGVSMVVLNSSEALTSTIALRRQNCEIVYMNYEGVRIPREAIRVSDEGVQGVYCVAGVEVKFKAVTIVFERDNYYIVKYTPELKNALRPGDEVVVAGKELFDGKIIR